MGSDPDQASSIPAGGSGAFPTSTWSTARSFRPQAITTRRSRSKRSPGEPPTESCGI